MPEEYNYQATELQPESHRVPDKRTMFELLKKGEFGNTMPLWSLADFRAYAKSHPFPKSISIRSMDGAKGTFMPNIHSIEELEAKLRESRLAARDEESLIVGEGIEDEEVLFSGDIMRSVDYYDLTYTEPGSEKHSSRDVNKHARGLQAKALIETSMDHKGLATLQDIFHKYPNSVVEFSVLKSKGGTLGSNTIFWEVRNY